jgi:hypothetical protein
MEPFKPDVKKDLLADAAKAFPAQSAQELEEKFAAMEKLLAQRFNTESGVLPAEDAERLQQLVSIFRPFQI